MVGTTISHYKVLEKIGQGGMGEVYRAEDTTLKREVAIKVLPEQFTKDPQRLARFEREAQLLAQLNHPNIAAIYGLEEADGVRFLALELVPGETLQERVASGPVPVEEALEVCRQIAEGVEAAHEKGVIHRDLKPANVKVTPEGRVKILDFGLAKAFEAEIPAADISQSPTLTEEMTRAGVILGTAAYMSPEQAKGQPVDKRADIFAFGAVLYELLTGKRAFEGQTITETIAAVLKSEPDWNALPTTTPWRIQDLLRRCLQKDVHDRLDGVANLRIEIKLAQSEPTAVAPSGLVSVVQFPLWKRIVPWSVTALIAVISIITVWNLIRPAPSVVTTLSIVTPTTTPVASTRHNDVAISPDGRHIVFRGSQEGSSQLYVRSLSALEADPISETEGVNREFFFSPDSQWVVFVVDGKQKKVSISGGAPVTLCDAPFQEGGYWGPDDVIVFADGAAGDTNLLRVSANGGQPEILAKPDHAKGELEYQHPEILPDGNTLLFDISHGVSEYQIAALSLETGEQKILVEAGQSPHYVSTGHLVYALVGTGTLMAAPFDLDKVEITGGAIPILEGVSHTSGVLEGNVDYSFSTNGSLVYVAGGGGGESTVVWVDREGNSEPLLDTPDAYSVLRLSPDGQHLAVGNDEGGGDVWTYDLVRGVLSRLTFHAGWDRSPAWTPDSQRIVFNSARGGSSGTLFWKAADGSGETEQLTSGGAGQQVPFSFTPDAKVLAFVEPNPETGWDIWTLQLDGDRTPELFLRTDANENGPAFSPDGRWIAYESDESGQNEIYVRPFPASASKSQISTGGGETPRWAPDGSELFYLEEDRMMSVPVTIGDSFQPGTPSVLFTHDNPSGPPPAYSVSPDGQRFVMLQPSEQETPGQINVILNWFEELKRLVPTE